MNETDTIIDVASTPARTLELEPQIDQPVQLHRPTTQHAVVESSPAMLLRLAVERGADLDQLQRMYEMERQWKRDNARDAYVAAMTAFKAEPIEIIKRKEVNFNDTHYKHAELSDVTAAVCPLLSKHGLSHRWDVEQRDGKIIVSCVVMHKAGHSERLTMEAPADTSGKKNAIQSIGSTKTYLERYTLLGILGLSTKGEDDDGKAAGEAGENATKLLAEQILNDYRVQLAKVNTDHGCLALYKAAAIALECTRNMEAINEWRAAVADRRNAIKAGQS